METCLHAQSQLVLCLAPMFTCMPSLQVVPACLPSPIADDSLSSTISPPPLPLPVSNSCLLRWCQPLYSSCQTVLLCFSGTAWRFKMCFCVCAFTYYLLCIICRKVLWTIIVQYYRVDCICWLPRPFCWTYDQIGLKNVLSEWNFVHMYGTFCND